MELYWENGGKFQLTNTKQVMTLMDPDAWFSKDQGPSTLDWEFWMQDVPYALVIDSVLWLVIISHLDAAFTIGILSQFIQNLGQAHWEGVRRVIAYLGTTKDLWMTFGRCGKMILKGFCDMDWAGQLHRHLILHIHSTWALELSLGAQKSNTSSPCWVLKQSTSHRCMLQRKWCICTCL